SHPRQEERKSRARKDSDTLSFQWSGNVVQPVRNSQRLALAPRRPQDRLYGRLMRNSTSSLMLTLLVLGVAGNGSVALAQSPGTFTASGQMITPRIFHT